MNTAGRPNWTEAAQKTLIVLLSLPPVLAAFRYRWPQTALPIALVPSVFLIAATGGLSDAWQTLRVRLHSPLLLSGLACIGWILASILWSPDFKITGIVLIKALMGLTSALVVASAASTLERDRLFTSLCSALTVAAIGEIVLTVSDGAIHRYFNLHQFAAGIQPERSGIAAIIALFLTPCIAWLLLTRRKMPAIILSALCVVAIIISGSGASLLALAASVATVALGFLLPRLALRVPLLILIAGFVTASLLGRLEHFEFANRLFDMLETFHIRERVQIWSFYDQLFWHRPWTGFGAGIERLLGDADTSSRFTQLIPPENAQLHPHNGALQILIEFGLIGMILLLVFMGYVTSWFTRQAHLRSVAAISPISAFIAASLANFGLWEWWWIGSGSAAIICALHLLDDRKEASKNKTALWATEPAC